MKPGRILASWMSKELNVWILPLPLGALRFFSVIACTSTASRGEAFASSFAETLLVELEELVQPIEFRPSYRSSTI